MACLANLISTYRPELALDKILPVIKLYEEEGFTENLNTILYYAYSVYSKAGEKQGAEKYKQRLLNEFPNSFWSKQIRDKK